MQAVIRRWIEFTPERAVMLVWRREIHHRTRCPAELAEVILYGSAHRRRTTAGIMGPTNLSGFVQR
jgi:hypothetical protein